MTQVLCCALRAFFATTQETEPSPHPEPERTSHDPQEVDPQRAD